MLLLLLLSGCMSSDGGICTRSLELRHTVSCVYRNDSLHVNAVPFDAP